MNTDPRSDAKLNRIIAEWIGYKVNVYRDPEAWHPLPSYCTDLNAIHEAEKKLDAGQWDDYQQQLREQVRGKGAHPRDISSSHATARQRAEALVNVIEGGNQ